MGATKGLSDNQSTLIATIFAVFFTVTASLAGLPDDQRPPVYVMTILSVIGSAALVIKAQLGIRDATTARVAKQVDPKLLQFRRADLTQFPDEQSATTQAPSSPTASSTGPPALPPSSSSTDKK